MVRVTGTLFFFILEIDYLSTSVPLLFQLATMLADPYPITDALIIEA
jgi:hypothetical protein